MNLTCLNNDGCKSTTLGPLFYLDSIDETTSLKNFMGSTNFMDERWIAKDTFSRLLKAKQSAPNPVTQTIILVRGFFDRTTGTYEQNKLYEIQGISTNLSEITAGNVSILTYLLNGSIQYNLSFSPKFNFNGIEGNASKITNYSFFSYVLPTDATTARIEVKENQILKSQVNRTLNGPSVFFEEPNNSMIFSNQLFNVSWSGSDLDGDNLSYSLFFSIDNITYQSMVLDYANTSITLNSSNFNDCDNCTFKILASDGFNTVDNYSAVFRIDNDLSIRNFSVIYANQTERVFKFILNNTLNVLLGNVNWNLDLGEGVLTSSLAMSIPGGTQVPIIIYHNYSNFGTYNLTAKTTAGDYFDIRFIQIIV